MFASALAILAHLWLLTAALAAVHTHNFNVLWVEANPDGIQPRRMIGVNGEWPLPTLRVKRGDRVILNVFNGLGDRNTSVHFHGLMMSGQNAHDGPEMLTQCPIPPGVEFTYNFTVDGQSGTYWYHSHLGSQYADGLRGVFIIEDDDKHPYKYDEEVVLLVSEHYHDELAVIMKSFLSRYNPTGAEPIPQNALFNETRNVTWNVAPDTTYLVRIVNMGLFTSQYLALEGYNMTIVEIDGVHVKPKTVSSLYITVAQRYAVLVHTGPKGSPNTRFINAIDKTMLDVIPPDLQMLSTNYMVYDKKAKMPPALENNRTSFESWVDALEPFTDWDLVPASKPKLLPDPDYRITLNFTMENLGDGVVYAFFNNITYTPPKVPTLMSVFSSGEYATDGGVYGDNTNTFVLQKNEVVEIVVNNMDPGKHPFHLHGHQFQVIARSDEGDEEDSLIYDPDTLEFPEHPMMRDTVEVLPNGYMAIRFVADNPGVWFFHCHVDWHLEQGLAITLVEDPQAIQLQEIPENHYKVCEAAGVPYYGNAAGNFGDSKLAWLNLDGENRQHPPLPEGFTRKGWIALFVCAITAIYGLYTIYSYGIEDVTTDETEQLVQKLYKLVEEHQ